MSTNPETKAAEDTSAETQATPGTARQRAKPATTEAGIRLTEKAAEQILSILKKDNFPEASYLYVGVKGGGCSGLSYILDLRKEENAPIADTDEVFESHGIVVVADMKSYIVGALSGTSIDFQDEMVGGGFTFNNPNAKHSCGCGSSYSA